MRAQEELPDLIGDREAPARTPPGPATRAAVSGAVLKTLCSAGTYISAANTQAARPPMPHEPQLVGEEADLEDRLPVRAHRETVADLRHDDTRQRHGRRGHVDAGRRSASRSACCQTLPSSPTAATRQPASSVAVEEADTDRSPRRADRGTGTPSRSCRAVRIGSPGRFGGRSMTPGSGCSRPSASAGTWSVSRSIVRICSSVSGSGMRRKIIARNGIISATLEVWK